MSPRLNAKPTLKGALAWFLVLTRLNCMAPVARPCVVKTAGTGAGAGVGAGAGAGAGTGAGFGVTGVVGSLMTPAASLVG